ncbi:sigma-S stabilization anti-adapter protein IraP [Citrobacter freundii]|uniref:sigma-S stabilization anti-adapter protein IraP n=1 Tax=Citrobacter freundii TaxID=546 RepID=UPI00383B2B6C
MLQSVNLRFINRKHIGVRQTVIRSNVLVSILLKLLMEDEMSEQELKLEACYCVLMELVRMLPSAHHQQLTNKLNQRIDDMLKSDGFNHAETMVLKKYIDGLIK